MTGPPILTSPLLAALSGVRHAFFTRAGGVSSGVCESLNAGIGSADDPAAVRENRSRAAALFGVGPEALAGCFQIHSAQVVTASAPFGPERPRADGVVTDRPGIVCCALAADCAPVLLADSDAGVVGAVHAGWRGALAGVVEAGVTAMVALGARRERIAAAVGPCIAQASYEVGPDFFAAFTERDEANAGFFQPAAASGKHRFDLPGFVLARLAAAGVEQAASIGLDTCADETRFFSNRRATLNGEAGYGRLLSAIMLERRIS
jgi:hypothetical protein